MHNLTLKTQIRESLSQFENPLFHDNRNYSYSGHEISIREEYPLILEKVPPGSRVVDLGCGNGSLLSLLRDQGCLGVGVELSESGVEASRKKGLEVIQGKIDRTLHEFSDRQFDFGICNVTVQMVMYPEILLKELARISRFQIVSFPNFAFFRNRMDLLFNGRMPCPQLFGYPWYSTGHIHQLSFRDYEEFCYSNGLKILDFKEVGSGSVGVRRFLRKHWPNLFVATGLYLTDSDGLALGNLRK